jgi:hypothetical protein
MCTGSAIGHQKLAQEGLDAQISIQGQEEGIELTPQSDRIKRGLE